MLSVLQQLITDATRFQWCRVYVMVGCLFVPSVCVSVSPIDSSQRPVHIGRQCQTAATSRQHPSCDQRSIDRLVVITAMQPEDPHASSRGPETVQLQSVWKDICPVGTSDVAYAGPHRHSTTCLWHLRQTIWSHWRSQGTVFVFQWNFYQACFVTAAKMHISLYQYVILAQLPGINVDVTYSVTLTQP